MQSDKIICRNCGRGLKRWINNSYRTGNSEYWIEFYTHLGFTSPLDDCKPEPLTKQELLKRILDKV